MPNRLAGINKSFRQRGIIMKKIAIALIFLATVTSTVFAGGSLSSLNLRYPIVLVHGYAGSDQFILGIDYFYGIQEALEDQGAKVFVVDMSAFNTSSVRAQQLKTFVLRVLAITGKSKVNIIAHSQGGLTARYMISNLGMAGKVATLVMISAPNRGTALADVVIGKLPNAAQWAISAIANTLWGGIIAGEANSDFLAATNEMTHDYMNNVFNPNTPDSPSVKYYSYAGKMYAISPNIIFTPTWLLLRYYDGDSDGIVPVASARWGIWKGTITGLFGVDHFMEINHLFGNTPGFDAEGFYVNVAKMLKNNGF